MDTVKPGWTTSEFWSTAIIQVINAVATLAALYHKNFDKSTLEPLIPVASNVAAGLALVWYSHSRSQVKQQAIHASTTLALASSGPAVAAPGQVLVWPDGHQEHVRRQPVHNDEK